MGSIIEFRSQENFSDQPSREKIVELITEQLNALFEAGELREKTAKIFVEERDDAGNVTKLEIHAPGAVENHTIALEFMRSTSGRCTIDETTYIGEVWSGANENGDYCEFYASKNVAIYNPDTHTWQKF